MPPWVLKAMQKAAVGGEDHPNERETKRPKWSREQHLRDLDSAIGRAMFDLQKYREMIRECKSAESEEEKVRLFNKIRDDDKLRKSTARTGGRVGGELQKMRNSYPK